MRSLLLAAVAASSMLPMRGEACDNAVRSRTEEAVIRAKTIENALAVGKLETVEELAMDVEDPAIQRRINIAVTTARMRYRGKVADLLEQFPVYLKETPDDPVLHARFAEALARGTAEQRRMAKTSLELLASRDLIAEPEAWAALARLRAAEKDGKGAAAAAQRCAKMTVRKGVCPKL